MAEFVHNEWVTTSEKRQLLGMQRVFVALVLSGGIVLGLGSFLFAGLTNSWASLSPALAAMGIGAVVMGFGIRMNIRGQVYRATIQARQNKHSTGVSPAGSASLPNHSLVEPGPPLAVTVDMAAFLAARQRSAHDVRPTLVPMSIAFSLLGGFVCFEAIKVARTSPIWDALALGSLGALTSLISVLLFLILLAPGIPNLPARLEIDSTGLRVTRRRGPPSVVAWGDPGLRLFLLDTRASARRPGNDGSPVMWLYHRALGQVPITPEAVPTLRSLAERWGMKVDTLPVGERGPLPRGPRMSLPFGSEVTVLSYP